MSCMTAHVTSAEILETLRLDALLDKAVRNLKNFDRDGQRGIYLIFGKIPRCVKNAEISLLFIWPR